jgi:hypothetical protein
LQLARAIFVQNSAAIADESPPRNGERDFLERGSFHGNGAHMCGQPATFTELIPMPYLFCLLGFSLGVLCAAFVVLSISKAR